NGYLQTSATAQEVYEPGAVFEVDFPAAVAAATQVQLLGPNNTTLTLTRASNISYFYTTSFSSEAALNQAIPDGTYSVVVSGGGGTSNMSLPLQGGAN